MQYFSTIFFTTYIILINLSLLYFNRLSGHITAIQGILNVIDINFTTLNVIDINFNIQNVIDINFNIQNVTDIISNI